MAVRGLLSIGLLAIAFYAGFAPLPLWSIGLIGILFTIAYIQGKWYLWNEVFQAGGGKLYQSLFVTYLIQLVIVAIFYLLGSGVARLFNRWSDHDVSAFRSTVATDRDRCFVLDVLPRWQLGLLQLNRYCYLKQPIAVEDES